MIFDPYQEFDGITTAPVCLPDPYKESMYYDGRCWTAGWGYNDATNHLGQKPRWLRTIDTHLFDDQVCIDRYPPNKFSPEVELCGSHTGDDKVSLKITIPVLVGSKFFNLRNGTGTQTHENTQPGY